MPRLDAMVPYLLPLAAILLGAVGVLIATEVLRPFRDLKVDGPIAFALWIVGCGLAITGLATGTGRTWACITALAANGLCLLAVGALLLILGRNRRLF